MSYYIIIRLANVSTNESLNSIELSSRLRCINTELSRDNETTVMLESHNFSPNKVCNAYFRVTSCSARTFIITLLGVVLVLV